MTQETLTLYYRPGTCALAPQILMAEIAVPYSAKVAPRNESYKAINPAGAVPALVLETGEVITQVDAILNYLCERFDRRDLVGGDDILLRAQTAQWCAFLTGDLHPAFFPVFVPERYVSPDTEAARASAKAAGITLVESMLVRIEARLSRADWLAGGAIGIADFYVVPMLRWVTLIREGGLGDWPSTRKWYEQICTRASVIEAMQAQGIAP